VTAVRVSGLYAGYGGAQILNGVDLEVGEAEIVALIGPNGAGKSTCVKVIAGLLPWTHGEIEVGDVRVTSASGRDPARASLGYVPQVRNTFPSLSVRENLQVMAPRSWSRRRIGAGVAYLLDQFPQLARLAERPAGLLSGGERQGLALAMALVREPTVLLLDEPAAALSPRSATEVFAMVGRLRERGVSVLVVEQNVRLALAASDRCYVLEGGRVALEGTAAALLDDPRLGGLYLGADVADPEPETVTTASHKGEHDDD
jgi:ABC-type branched-subunit amino acid transport system ATPase component